MKLGFIGTGKIASSVIEGICNSKISYTKIIISSRNRIIARKLEKKFNLLEINTHIRLILMLSLKKLLILVDLLDAVGMGKMKPN